VARSGAAAARRSSTASSVGPVPLQPRGRPLLLPSEGPPGDQGPRNYESKTGISAGLGDPGENGMRSGTSAGLGLREFQAGASRWVRVPPLLPESPFVPEHVLNCPPLSRASLSHSLETTRPGQEPPTMCVRQEKTLDRGARTRVSTRQLGGCCAASRRARELSSLRKNRTNPATERVDTQAQSDRPIR
jgi:hypothetical protein